MPQLVIALTGVCALMAILLWRLARQVAHLQDIISDLCQFNWGPRGKEGYPDLPTSNPTLAGISRSTVLPWQTPPPAPPPFEDPSPYALSILPDELAAELEAEERDTYGTSSKNTCAAWGEADERDAELEDAYTVSIAQKIRSYSGENC